MIVPALIFLAAALVYAGITVSGKSFDGDRATALFLVMLISGTALAINTL